VGGELGGHAAHLPSAHGVGLTGEREGTRAGTPDLPGRQVQVDEAEAAHGAGHRMVQPLAPQREARRRARDEVRGSADQRRVDAAQRGGTLRRPPRRHRGDLLEPGGVLADVLTVEHVVLDARLQQ
jgi:hypothetical protein